MDKLDEIILSKSENGFGFCNKKGIQILENIEKLLQQSVDQSKQKIPIFSLASGVEFSLIYAKT